MQRFFERIRNFLISRGYERDNMNFPLLFVVLLLCAISVFVIYVIGAGYNKQADYIKQLTGIGIGLIVVFVFSLVDYHFICKFVIIYYVVVNLLLLATRYSPLGTDNDTGAYRWIRFPGFDLQPSELCKLMIIFALAVLFSRFQHKLKSFIPLILAVVITAIPLFIILKQPDLSSSLVIIFILLVMIYSSEISYNYSFSFTRICLGIVADSILNGITKENTI